MLNTPVLFLIFNRPLHTQKVFEQIRIVKPKRLFISADGPRIGVETDIENCSQTRSWVLHHIDWDCEVKTLFSEFNLGCGVAPAKAITWFFENVEEGIILEDDCLPNSYFFGYCAELLALYRDERMVMHISGNNFQDGRKRGAASYYFSAYGHIWGWATWRRSWAEFEYSIRDFDRDGLLVNFKDYGFNRREREFWIATLENMRETRPTDIWDYQWSYALWQNAGVCILPNENLVVNIGFGSDATHTKMIPQYYTGMRNGKMDTLVHPPQIIVDTEADHYTFKMHLHVRDSFYRRLKNKLILNSSIRLLYEKTKKLRE